MGHSATKDSYLSHITITMADKSRLSIEFLRFESSEEVSCGSGNNLKSNERVQGTGISKISKLSSNVESKIMVCLWHTIFEKKRI